MIIGLISDTHVRVPGTRAALSSLTAEELPKQVLDAFQGVDLILHAGDVYSLPILDELETVAPVMVAEGDDDPFEIVNDRRAKHEHFLTVEGVTIWMSHYGLWSPNNGHEMPDVAVYGHSHSKKVEQKNGTLWVNPGSPTFPHYQHIAGTVAILTVENGQHELNVIQLEGPISNRGTSGIPGFKD